MNRGLSQFSFAGFVFPQVGGAEALTFGDLNANCSEDGSTYDTGWQALADSIVMLDEYGTYKKDIVYVPEWLLGEVGLTTKGWYDKDDIAEGNDFNSEPLAFGEAVQICILDDVGAQITFAGEVKKGPTPTDLVGFMGIANCSPKKIYGEDVIVNCSEDGSTYDTGWQALADSIVMLDEYGTYKKDIVYVPEWLLGEVGLTTNGWYDKDDITEGNDFNHSEDFCWEPGQGFQVCILDDIGATVTIKSALAKDAE